MRRSQTRSAKLLTTEGPFRGLKARTAARGAGGSLHWRFETSQGRIREVLALAQAGMAAAGLSAILRAEAELVLAEALNNIDEHAYAAGGGRVDLWLRRCGDGLLCLISDFGAAMPDGCLPKGQSPLTSTARGDLPEGGFGWHLIRLLARDLQYRRKRGRNRLAILLDAHNWR